MFQGVNHFTPKGPLQTRSIFPPSVINLHFAFFLPSNLQPVNASIHMSCAMLPNQNTASIIKGSWVGLFFSFASNMHAADQLYCLLTHHNQNIVVISLSVSAWFSLAKKRERQRKQYTQLRQSLEESGVGAPG